jgi:hypothetical protein
MMRMFMPCDKNWMGCARLKIDSKLFPFSLHFADHAICNPLLAFCTLPCPLKTTGLVRLPGQLQGARGRNCKPALPFRVAAKRTCCNRKTGAIVASAWERVAYADSFLVVSKEGVMNLAVWLPALFVLGLATMGALFAFVAACDRV